MDFLDISNLKHNIKVFIKGQRTFKSSAWLSKKSAAHYNKVVEKDFFEKITWPLIKNNLPNNPSRILDVGCGTGRLTHKIIEHFNQINKETKFYALDISKNMMSFINKNQNIEIIESDAFSSNKITK